MLPLYGVINLFALALIFQTTAPVFAEASTSLKSYYSPIVRLEPDKGFFLITTDSGIQWIKVNISKTGSNLGKHGPRGK